MDGLNLQSKSRSQGTQPVVQAFGALMVLLTVLIPALLLVACGDGGGEKPQPDVQDTSDMEEGVGGTDMEQDLDVADVPDTEDLDATDLEDQPDVPPTGGVSGVIMTGGGGSMSSNDGTRLIIGIGAPQPMGQASSGQGTVQLGPAALFE